MDTVIVRDQVVLINRVCYKKNKQDKTKIHGEVGGGGGMAGSPNLNDIRKYLLKWNTEDSLEYERIFPQDFLQHFGQR